MLKIFASALAVISVAGTVQEVLKVNSPPASFTFPDSFLVERKYYLYNHWDHTREMPTDTTISKVDLNRNMIMRLTRDSNGKIISEQLLDYSKGIRIAISNSQCSSTPITV